LPREPARFDTRSQGARLSKINHSKNPTRILAQTPAQDGISATLLARKRRCVMSRTLTHNAPIIANGKSKIVIVTAANPRPKIISASSVKRRSFKAKKRPQPGAIPLRRSTPMSRSAMVAIPSLHLASLARDTDARDGEHLPLMRSKFVRAFSLTVLSPDRRCRVSRRSSRCRVNSGRLSKRTITTPGSAIRSPLRCTAIAFSDSAPLAPHAHRPISRWGTGSEGRSVAGWSRQMKLAMGSLKNSWCHELWNSLQPP
jgi:hypothetical protein